MCTFRTTPPILLNHLEFKLGCCTRIDCLLIRTPYCSSNIFVCYILVTKGHFRSSIAVTYGCWVIFHLTNRIYLSVHFITNYWYIFAPWFMMFTNFVFYFTKKKSVFKPVVVKQVDYALYCILLVYYALHTIIP